MLRLRVFRSGRRNFCPCSPPRPPPGRQLITRLAKPGHHRRHLHVGSTAGALQSVGWRGSAGHDPCTSNASSAHHHAAPCGPGIHVWNACSSPPSSRSAWKLLSSVLSSVTRPSRWKPSSRRLRSSTGAGSLQRDALVAADHVTLRDHRDVRAVQRFAGLRLVQAQRPGLRRGVTGWRCSGHDGRR